MFPCGYSRMCNIHQKGANREGLLTVTSRGRVYNPLAITALSQKALLS